MRPDVQDRLVRRLQEKITKNADKILLYEEDQIEGADVVVVSYGITSRVAQRAIEMAREKGIKVGKFRLITAWPFPEKQIAEIAAKVKAIVVPEINLGQMVREVERAAAGKAVVRLVRHAGGSVHHPEDILQGHHGGGAMSELTYHSQPSRAVSADGPHSAHLVSGMRHRHQRQLFRPRADRRQDRYQERWLSSPASAAPAASPATSIWTRSTPRTAARFLLPPD